MGDEDFTAVIHPRTPRGSGRRSGQALETRTLDSSSDRRRTAKRAGSHTRRGFHYESGVPVRMLGAMLDVTDRHQADGSARLLDREPRRAPGEPQRANDHFLATSATVPAAARALLASGLAGHPLPPSTPAAVHDRRHVELAARLIDACSTSPPHPAARCACGHQPTPSRRAHDEICCERKPRRPPRVTRAYGRGSSPLGRTPPRPDPCL